MVGREPCKYVDSNKVYAYGEIKISAAARLSKERSDLLLIGLVIPITLDAMGLTLKHVQFPPQWLVFQQLRHPVLLVR